MSALVETFKTRAQTNTTGKGAKIEKKKWVTLTEAEKEKVMFHFKYTICKAG